jgi:hypothetical protein
MLFTANRFKKRKRKSQFIRATAAATAEKIIIDLKQRSGP